ncbi:hypothetical protein ACIGXM_11145 [Kitasatospora sp. NPDC052896]|uniref:hypothetical protein n=1 Tax=Kitasatospora sp. NPDC052896 TaxID=3364061 RepID=UPI0037CBBFEA
MATISRVHGDVESTIALLERELPALEEQKQRLEGELGSVTERLAAVRGALESLHSLATAPFLQEKGTEAAEPEAPKKPVRARRAAKAARTSAPAAKRKAAAPAGGARGRAKAAPVAEEAAAPQAAAKRASGLTEAIVAHLLQAGGPVKVREVAEALGRDATPSAVNTVRTSLERLAKASRAQRVGRGLYQAQAD